MKFVWILFKLSILGLVLMIGFGFLGQFHPAFDTFSHLRVYFSIALLGAGFIFLILGRFWRAILSILVGVIGLVQPLQYIMPPADAPSFDRSKPVHQVFHLNLYWNNHDHETVIDHIQQVDADFLSLIEINKYWEASLSALDEQWPYAFHCAEWEGFGGIKIYSKWPMVSDTDFCGFYGSFAKTKVKFADGREIALGSTHPRWPWPASGPKQYRTFMPVLKKLEPSALIVGDFNATPWSQSAHDFAQTGNLTVVKGIGGTWLHELLPRSLIRWIGLPIDFVMHKGEITILSAKTLENLGSDHLPVLVEFQLN
ncbi:MAG: endonuclease/exonuclease/phosphatase family protein [Pseudomonadota bacterium]